MAQRQFLTETMTECYEEVLSKLAQEIAQEMEIQAKAAVPRVVGYAISEPDANETCNVVHVPRFVDLDSMTIDGLLEEVQRKIRTEYGR